MTCVHISKLVPDVFTLRCNLDHVERRPYTGYRNICVELSAVEFMQLYVALTRQKDERTERNRHKNRPFVYLVSLHRFEHSKLSVRLTLTLHIMSKTTTYDDDINIYINQFVLISLAVFTRVCADTKQHVFCVDLSVLSVYVHTNTCSPRAPGES